ncbi:hypothetical protein G6F22_020467 [Rhizopus arrhizus]|nr:hypothetical protein G6F22_020467 [Rhizopus arrhizus]
MRNGCGASQRQTGHHGHDGGERDGRQETQQQIAAHGVGQVDRDHIGAADQAFHHVEPAVRAGREILGVAHQQRDRSKDDDEREQIEVA